MKYDVDWKPAAERDLAAIWLRASDRAVITAASNRLDQILSLNPSEQGESRDGDVRVLIELPLGVYFRVLEQTHTVEVGAVWLIQTRSA